MIDLVFGIGVSNLCVSLALAVVAWVVQAWGKQPAIAHLLWLLVLVKLVTPPLFTVPVLAVPGIHAGSPSALAGSLNPDAAAALAGLADGLNAEVPTRTAQAEAIEPSFLAEHWPALLLILWALGSVGVLSWSLVRVHRFNQLLRVAARDALRDVQDVAADMARRLGLRKTPTVWTTDAQVSPLVWWTGGRVRIVLPDALVRDLDDAQLRWIVAHELAHVRRRDHLVRWLEWLACVAFWWNPIAWWARRNLRVNEEICCDALVLSILEPRPQSYANALMTVVEFLASPVIRPPAVASEMNSGGLLEKRFTMIVSNTPVPKIHRWLRASLLACAVGLLPLGFVSADAAVQDRGRVASESQDDQFLEILAELVVSGSMTDELAYELYAASQEARKSDLVAGGRTTAEAFERRLKTAMKVAMVEARLNRAVAEGAMSKEDAELRLAGMRKEMLAEGRQNDEWDLIRRRIEAAVERGDITREEADAEYGKLKQHMSKRSDDADAIWRRVAAALGEAGVERDQIKQVMGTMHRIVGEVKAEGDAFELDPGIQTYLDEELGLNDDQIKLVIALSQRVAASSAREAQSNQRADAMWRRIAVALTNAGIEREQIRPVMGVMQRVVHEMQQEGNAFELNPRFEVYLVDKLGLTDEQITKVVALSERVANAQEGSNDERSNARSDWNAIQRRIEHAVEQGEMTRAEADALHRSLRERMSKQRGR